MKNSVYSRSNAFFKEKKVPAGSFFSFFVFFFVLFFLCSCFSLKTAEKKEAVKVEKSEKRMKKMEDIRLLRLLLVEEGKYILAERAIAAAAEQLALQLRVTRTSGDLVYPLLRADKADLAFGLQKDASEVKRFRLEGYELALPENHSLKHSLYFIMPSGSEELWGLLEKAAISAAANGRISFQKIPEEKSPAMTAKKTEKRMEKEKTAEKGKIPSAKFKKRERLRRKIYQGLQKMKKYSEAEK